MNLIINKELRNKQISTKLNILIRNTWEIRKESEETQWFQISFLMSWFERTNVNDITRTGNM